MTNIKNLLVEQHKSILDGLKGDLRAYLNYKFDVEVAANQFAQIRTMLLEYEKTSVPESVIEPAHKDAHYGFNWFYREINEVIRCILHPLHLELGINSGRGKDGIDITDLNASTESNS